MSAALIGQATSFATTIFSYFNPARSPYYGVIAFGTAALVLSATGIDVMPWWFISVPVYMVLVISLRLSLVHQPSFTQEQGEDQLRFARSFSLSSALMAFVLTARVTEENSLAFWTNYFACVAQIAVFLAYTWARSRAVEEQGQFNYVQFALINATFLIGASYANVEYASSRPTEGGTPGPETIRHLLVAAFLYLLWLVCLLRWIKHLATLIRVEIPQGTP